MERRPLGRSGLDASVFAFGALSFTGGGSTLAALGELDVTGARRIVDICLEAGITLFDVANIYAGGVSEQILGQALGARRNDVLIATKGFGRMERGGAMGNGRAHLIASCEASLKRLGTDRIDLYQLHEYDALTPLEETMAALDELVTSGKVRAVGCSNFGGWQLMKALAIADRAATARFATQQIYYSLLARDAEHELVPVSIDQDVGILIWGPLSSGYLTGKFRHGAKPEGRIAAMGNMDLFDPAAADAIVEMVAEVAEERGATPGQVALNWLLRKPGVSSVILGARDEVQLRDNLAAAEWRLSDEEMTRLDSASAPRLPYPLNHQRSIYAAERNPAPYSIQ